MIQVRAAVPEDAHDAAKVHVRSWQSAYRGLIAQDHLDSLDPQVWATRYTFGRVGMPSTLVAVDGSTVCGLATVGFAREADLPNFGELLAMYVDPGCIRTGIGRLLITAARERLRAVGVVGASLWVLDGNAGARRFYENDGWTCDGSRKTRIWADQPADEVRYRREPV